MKIFCGEEHVHSSKFFFLRNLPEFLTIHIYTSSVGSHPRYKISLVQMKTSVHGEFIWHILTVVGVVSCMIPTPTYQRQTPPAIQDTTDRDHPKCPCTVPDNERFQQKRHGCENQVKDEKHEETDVVADRVDDAVDGKVPSVFTNEIRPGDNPTNTEEPEENPSAAIGEFEIYAYGEKTVFAKGRGSVLFEFVDLKGVITRGLGSCGEWRVHVFFWRGDLL